MTANTENTKFTGDTANEELANIPAQWKLNYFNKIDPMNSHVEDRLRQEVIFRRFNLMEEHFPFFTFRLSQSISMHPWFCSKPMGALIWTDSIDY